MLSKSKFLNDSPCVWSGFALIMLLEDTSNHVTGLAIWLSVARDAPICFLLIFEYSQSIVHGLCFVSKFARIIRYRIEINDRPSSQFLHYLSLLLLACLCRIRPALESCGKRSLWLLLANSHRTFSVTFFGVCSIYCWLLSIIVSLSQLPQFFPVYFVQVQMHL